MTATTPLKMCLGHHRKTAKNKTGRVVHTTFMFDFESITGSITGMNLSQDLFIKAV